MSFNTTEIKKHFPVFYDKLGPNKKLKTYVDFKDVNVQFGKYDKDVIVEYTVGFEVK